MASERNQDADSRLMRNPVGRYPREQAHGYKGGGLEVAAADANNTVTDSGSLLLMAPGIPPVLWAIVVLIGTRSPYHSSRKLDSNWACRQPVGRRSLAGPAPARSLCERFVDTNVDGALDQEAALPTSCP